MIEQLPPRERVRCITCGGSYLPKPGVINFHTGSCKKCSVDLGVCEVCKGVFPRKLIQFTGDKPVLCRDCGCCMSDCKCMRCSKCDVVFNEEYEGCKSCGTCWECCIEHKVITKKHEEASRAFIEPWLTTYYALNEIHGEILAKQADEMVRIRLKIDDGELAEYEKVVVEKIKRVEEALAKMYFDYLVAVCLGEIRHLCRVSHDKYGIGSVCGSKHPERELSISLSHKYNPEKALWLMKHGFVTSYFSGGYGGKKWSEICDAGLMYFTGGNRKTVFLDHVVDLTHNGGLFLGKTLTFFDFRTPVYLKLLNCKRSLGVLNMKMNLWVDEETKGIIEQGRKMRVVNVGSNVVVGGLRKPKEIVYGDRLLEVKWDHKVKGSIKEIDQVMKLICGVEVWKKGRGKYWEGIDEEMVGEMFQEEVKEVKELENLEDSLEEDFPC